MNHICRVLLVVLLAVLFAGCAPQKASMYYFGKTDATLYATKKEPTEENFLKLLQSLEDVITQSQQRGLKVPPGIHAHLGYLYLLEKKTEQATASFNEEKRLYPEATVFMERMIEKTDLSSKDTHGGNADA
jgi:hypothetical protein